MASKSFGNETAIRPSTLNKMGGWIGEVNDLRGDTERAFTKVETPGAGGTGVLAVEEFVDVAVADADFFMVSKDFSASAQTLTGTDLTGTTISPPRNAVLAFVISGGVGAGTVVVGGLDVDGNVLAENFTIPAATADVVGHKAFAKVTSVGLPAHGAAFTGSVMVGTGDKIGLGSKAKVRSTVATLLVELLDGVLVTESAAVNVVAVNNAMRTPTSYHAPVVPAPTDASIMAAVPVANGVQIIASQPILPCKLRFIVVDGDASITAGIATIVGVAWDGTVLTEDVSLVGAGVTVTEYAYASVTSITISDLAGEDGADTLSVGVSGIIGLPIPMTATNVVILNDSLFVNGAPEAVVDLDDVAMAVTSTTAPTGLVDFDITFTYDVTPTQVAHGHSASGAGVLVVPATGAPYGTYLPVAAPNDTRDYVVLYERDLT